MTLFPGLDITLRKSKILFFLYERVTIRERVIVAKWLVVMILYGFAASNNELQNSYLELFSFIYAYTWYNDFNEVAKSYGKINISDVCKNRDIFLSWYDSGKVY